MAGRKPKEEKVLDREFFQRAGRKGGLATLRKRGVKHYERIGVKGGVEKARGDRKENR